MKSKLTLIALFIVFTLSAKTTITRIEPMNWWVGMQNTELQILVYGTELVNATPEITYPGVTLKRIEKVENPNYLFLYLDIARETEPGSFKISFKNGKKLLAEVDYSLLERNKKSKIHQGFDASDAIYLLMPDRFSNGDITNDNVRGMIEKSDRANPNGRHGGDLQGIMNHLDYIANTGFTSIWLNPFLENNQEAYTYHGYAISDFYKVDARYGTNELFVQLVDSAHQKGLKIIMDMIFNHCGSAHWIYKDLPSVDWVHQHDNFFRSNFRAPAVSDPYASDYDRNQMLTGWFDTNMPDLNQNNPLLATYLIQNSIWWVEFSGMDGIRVDTQPYPYKAFMANWSEALMREYPTLNIVGEAWIQEIPITAYFQKNTKNKDGYNSNMPVVTDFPMQNALSKAFNEKEGWSEGMARLYTLLAQDFAYENPNNLLTFLDNHDLNRYFESVDRDIRKAKMGLAYLLTTRGIPQVYYGTEFLMDGLEHKGHGFIRKDFPGGWPNDSINVFTTTGLTQSQKEMYQFTSTILNWRKNNQIIHFGKLKHFLPMDGVYVLFRYNETGVVMLILNNNETENRLLKTNRFNEVIAEFQHATEIISGNVLDNLELIDVPAKSAMIIEFTK